jgi:hypothetical protein
LLYSDACKVGGEREEGEDEAAEKEGSGESCFPAIFVSDISPGYSHDEIGESGGAQDETDLTRA